MDRRHRALLGRTTAAVLIGWTLTVGKIGGQPAPGPVQTSPPPTPAPAASATPWVQASTPPQSPTPQSSVAPTPSPAAKPTPSATPKAPAATPTVTPATPAPKPTGTPTPPPVTPKPNAAGISTPAPPAAVTDEIKAKMLRQREREMNREQAFEQGSLLHEEQTTFEKNARLWNRLLPEEQQAILGQAGKRIREETEQAYGQTGLNLNDDQREVFFLRYRQERRRLERELQEKANNERSRRMPQILEQLKREFGKASTGNTPKPSPPPATPATSPGTTVNGAPTVVPSPSKA